MPQAIFNFPNGFLWGSATSSHQVEGNNANNNWSAWEAQPGKILEGARSGLACDWWGGRWREDFDRAAENGQNAHRLSIEWSRIQPAPDRWDEHALDYYREIVRGLVERKMTPIVTLHHFTDPLWLSDQGGWESVKAAQYFAAFTRKVVEALKEYVSLWVTINEPNVYTLMGYLSEGGEFPPGRNDGAAAFRVYCNLARGHAAAYHIIHQIQPQARVGIALHYRSTQPARPWFPLDCLASNLVFDSINNSFTRALTSGKMKFIGRSASIPGLIGTQDFFGLNYYTRFLVKFILNPSKKYIEQYLPTGAQISPNGFIAKVPEGMFEAIKWATQFRIPILITENGIEDRDDGLRPSYLAEHIHQLWRAINFNWPVKGYFHWSLVDNFEWERGWTQRFGLWGLNTETQARTRRPSVDLYAAISRENALSSTMVEKYAPQSLEKICPG